MRLYDDAHADDVQFLASVKRPRVVIIIGPIFVFQWFWFNFPWFVSIILISDIFFLQNFGTKQSGPNFSMKICCNFKLRTCTTTWKLRVLLTYKRLVYSSSFRKKQHFYLISHLFLIKSAIMRFKKSQYF